MKAYITSIGEPTTQLCKWSLERQGFEVHTIQDPKTSLAHKLLMISKLADDDYIRVDADIIVNQNVRDLIKETDLWWYQVLTFDWWKQDITHGGVQFVRKAALPFIRRHIQEIAGIERPESYLFRLPEFHNPRVCGTFEQVCGLNGYKQDDVNRVKATKDRRNQKGYDFDLALELNKL